MITVSGLTRSASGQELYRACMQSRQVGHARMSWACFHSGSLGKSYLEMSGVHEAFATKCLGGDGSILNLQRRYYVLESSII